MEKTRSRFKRNVVLVLTSVLLGGLGTACSSRPCREPRAPEMDVTKSPSATNASLSPVAMPGGVAPVLTPVPAPSAPKTNDAAAPVVRIRVYKPDGSRQCEKGGAKPTDAMERELAGIRVYAREKRNDGLMHIQVCGSPSGMINVFEIDSNFQKQAEERGFKRLED